MSQQNVLNLLKRKKKWMTNKQIAKSLKLSPGSVNLSVRKLFEQNLILRKTTRPNITLFGGIGANAYLYAIK